MGLVITFVCFAACISLGVLLLRARGECSRLRVQLKTASDLQRTQDSLLTQRSQLDTIKDEFISTVSHELRTPLTSIRGALGLLSAGLMGTVDAKAQNLLRIALTNTDRLIRLINDILDLERMESGRAPLHVRRCSLRDLARQAMETMKPMADSAGVALEFSLGVAPEGVFFDGDPDRILQILTNLLSNAIKFSPPESTVTIRLEADQTSVQLRVSDQGRGIPVDKLDSIFDRFQQVEASDARQKGGTGLGLAICRTIVQQHNGSIWAESNAALHRGPGASLVVSLPRMSRLVDQIDDKGIVLPLGDGTVILCDDDSGIRTIVGEHLKQHGYTILEADNGEQAIALAEQNTVSAILLDLYMPGLTGWETLQRLKNTPATAKIPVVILSVLSPSTIREDRQVASAAQGWIQKPFNEGLLLAELSRVLHAGEGPARVLLVEDDIDLASVVIAGFKDVQVRIDHASTREDAMEHCRRAAPDLIILDLTLPDGDGFSLVDWLRQQPDLRTLPLVVYSGREVSEFEMKQLQLGPTQFLTKAKVQPGEVEELVLNIVQRLRRPTQSVPAPESIAQPQHQQQRA
jgi:signal transduction histidine kinase/DNA-binding response OmpR family regulator